MNEPKWLKDEFIYQIYPQLFKDTINDGIGDLPSIIGKLLYVEGLGITAISDASEKAVYMIFRTVICICFRLRVIRESKF